MKGKNVNNLSEILEQAMRIDGAIGIALADHESGMCLGFTGSRASFDLEVAAAGNSEVIRSKLNVMASLNLDDHIQDMLITLGKEYHLMFPLADTTLFLYMALSRDKANLAMARHQLGVLARDLAV